MQQRLWNIPNTITFARMAIIPLLVVLHLWVHEYAGLVSCIIFAIAASTDWVDGYLARRLNLTTAFGAFLDPVADKLMVATALVLQVDLMDAWWFTIIAAIIICREITISALREWMAEIGKRANIAVHWIGKVKTVFQMIAIGALFFYQTYSFGWLYALLIVLFVIAAVLTIWSMMMYLKAAWLVIQEEPVYEE